MDIYTVAKIVLDDELYYVLTLIYMCTMSFAIGFVIGVLICM